VYLALRYRGDGALAGQTVIKIFLIFPGLCKLALKRFLKHSHVFAGDGDKLDALDPHGLLVRQTRNTLLPASPAPQVPKVASRRPVR
jgi:hypothetical protein